MIATNRYLEYWKNCISSFQKNVSSLERVHFYLFTDMCNDAEHWAREHLGPGKVEVIEIGPLVWPEATLLRYQIILDNSAQYQEGILMYLDSDMEVVSDFISGIEKNLRVGEMSFAPHPGYFLQNGYRGLVQVLFSPKQLIRRIISFLFNQQGIGAWENNRNSLAYLDRRKRKTYAHGAIWFGPKQIFLEMCRELKARTNADLEKGIIAIWHDESHLNWYIGNRKSHQLSTRFSWHSKYSKWLEVKPFIKSRENITKTR